MRCKLYSKEVLKCGTVRAREKSVIKTVELVAALGNSLR